MLVDKNIKKIQVPAVGKTISVPAVAAAIDSRTTTGTSFHRTFFNGTSFNRTSFKGTTSA
jgi:hypothetical protein